ncbi:MAG: hypothetical protein JKP95_02085 [Oceanicaulis sp.]|nr:hypothetical protein [Oceanicaulis sp.]
MSRFSFCLSGPTSRMAVRLLALALGPIIGVWAMLSLRSQDDAVKIAGGRK